MRLNPFMEGHFLLGWGAFDLQEIIIFLTIGLDLSKTCVIKLHFFWLHYGLRRPDTAPPLASLTSVQIGKLFFFSSKRIICLQFFIYDYF